MQLLQFSKMTALSNYVKAHERLILACIAALLLWFAVGKVESVIAAHDLANLTAEKAVLAAQQTKDAATAQLAQQQAVDFAAMTAQTKQQNAALEQANAALVAALSVQQKKDTVMTIPDLSTRWGQLVPGAGLSFVNSQLTISDAGAHATVNELEKVPVLTKELDAAKVEKVNVDALLLASTGQVATLNTLVAGKTLELKDADKVCDGRIKVVKDDNRKKMRRIAVVFTVVGFVLRQYIKSTTGL